MAPHVIDAMLDMADTDPTLHLEGVLPRVSAPTMLLSPGASVTSPLSEQEAMRDAIPACHQIVFEGASRHCPGSGTGLR
jgi:hypothetical protein